MFNNTYGIDTNNDKNWEEKVKKMEEWCVDHRARQAPEMREAMNECVRTCLESFIK